MNGDFRVAVAVLASMRDDVEGEGEGKGKEGVGVLVGRAGGEVMK